MSVISVVSTKNLIVELCDVCSIEKWKKKFIFFFFNEFVYVFVISYVPVEWHL